jgi:hypothetical protein
MPNAACVRLVSGRAEFGALVGVFAARADVGIRMQEMRLHVADSAIQGAWSGLAGEFASISSGMP